jgi:chromosome partitioning protein
LERLSQFVESVGQRHPLNVLGVLLSFWSSRGKSNAAFLDVIERAFPKKVLKTKVRRDINVSEASIFGKPLFETVPGSRAAEDYLMITKELLKRLQ